MKKFESHGLTLKEKIEKNRRECRERYRRKKGIPKDHPLKRIIEDGNETPKQVFLEIIEEQQKKSLLLPDFHAKIAAQQMLSELKIRFL